MDDRDPLLHDQIREGFGVAPDRERVLRRVGTFDDLGACGFRFAGEPPALGRDPGFAACLYDGARHVDRGALGAAGVKLRDDLKDGQRYWLGGRHAR